MIAAAYIVSLSGYGAGPRHFFRERGPHPSPLPPSGRGDLPPALPLWMDVPSAEAPAFAKMTYLVRALLFAGFY